LENTIKDFFKKEIMTENQYEELKNEYIEHIIDTVNTNGGLFPHISIFADVIDPDETDPAIIHIPIPDEYMVDDDTKDKFVSKIMPKIFKEVKKEFIPHAVLWASEAWLRTIEKNEEVPEDYRSLPVKQEVIIITIGTKETEQVKLYGVKRKGKQINQHGDMVDIIELIPMDDMSQPSGFNGKFTNLFNKFEK